MIRFALLVLITISTFAVTAQSFPADWEGIYDGKMVIGSTERASDTVGVVFELQTIVQDSSWTYRMTYTSARFGVMTKDYIIRRDGDNPSNFFLDELDGILIEMSLMNGCFYDVFEVMDQLYSTTMCLSEGKIRFDLYVSARTNPLVTNSEVDEEGMSYEVKSYKPSQHQTVVLTPRK